MSAASSLTSSQNLNGIIIPSGLLIFGTLIVKKEWAPYAVLLALALGSFKYFSQRMCLEKQDYRDNGLTRDQCPRSSSSPTTSKTSSSRRRPFSPTTPPCKQAIVVQSYAIGH